MYMFASGRPAPRYAETGDVFVKHTLVEALERRDAVDAAGVPHQVHRRRLRRDGREVRADVAVA